MNILRDNRGVMLALTMIFGSVAIIMIVGGLSSYVILENKASQHLERRESALHIAEAGIEYYRWHLKEAPADLTDGTGGPGPYVHPYANASDELVGYFSLVITSDATGIAVESTGWTLEAPSSTRTIVASFSPAVLTSEIVLANNNMQIHENTTIHGTIHSNGGIRFDGVTDSVVRSATSTYEYEAQDHDGVWGDGNMQNFWQFPAEEYNFASNTPDFVTLKANAQSDGLYITSSTLEGWRIQLSPTGLEVAEVELVNCTRGENNWKGDFDSYWEKQGDFCFDIEEHGDEVVYPLPANGIVFVDGQVWVEGSIDVDITIVSADVDSPSTDRNIVINGNLISTGATSTIGLYAQESVVIGENVPDDMIIEALMVAQNGVAARPPYKANTKNSLNFTGAHLTLYGPEWVYYNGFENISSGFETVTLWFDENLSGGALEGFLVGSSHEQIGWREL